MINEAIPKLRRAKDKDGKEIGYYYCRIPDTTKGGKVLLKTKDYMVARQRAIEASNGKREFKEGTEPMTATTPPSVADWSNPPTPSEDWTKDVADAATKAREGEPESVKPDKIYPPALPSIPETGTADPWTAPFADGIPKSPTGGPTSNADPPKDPNATYIPPEFLKNLKENCAVMLTELQIAGQEWLIARWAKAQAGEIPYNGLKAIGREAGKELWKQAIDEMFPSEIPLPPWLVAPIAVAALTIPVQLADAQPLKKKEEGA